MYITDKLPTHNCQAVAIWGTENVRPWSAVLIRRDGKVYRYTSGNITNGRLSKQSYDLITSEWYLTMDDIIFIVADGDFTVD